MALVSYLDPMDDMSHFLCRQERHCSWSPCWTGECCTERESVLVSKKTCFHLVAILINCVCVCLIEFLYVLNLCSTASGFTKAYM